MLLLLLAGLFVSWLVRLVGKAERAVNHAMEILRPAIVGALVELRKEPSGRWWAKLSRYGVDVVEYTVDCEPGIARHVKYWSA